MSEKTEQPTNRRLKQVREQGDHPISAALVQASGFVVALLVLPSAAALAAGHISAMIQAAVEGEGLPSWSVAAQDALVITVPLLLCAALAATATGWLQTGGAFTPSKWAADLTRLNPATGLKNLVSSRNLYSLVRACAAASLVLWLTLRLLRTHANDISQTVGELGAAGSVATLLTQKLLWIAAGVGVALALLDIVVTRVAWLKRHRMSRDEIKREHRESEGDPELKNARQRMHQELLQGATLNAVRDATVVIVNPTHFATALRYQDDEDPAPRVLAQGRDEMARKIIAAANAYGVAVVHDVPLARALSELEVGEEIPEALYEAVAEILKELWEQQEAEQAKE